MPRSPRPSMPARALPATSPISSLFSSISEQKEGTTCLGGVAKPTSCGMRSPISFRHSKDSGISETTTSGRYFTNHDLNEAKFSGFLYRRVSGCPAEAGQRPRIRMPIAGSSIQYSGVHMPAQAGGSRGAGGAALKSSSIRSGPYRHSQLRPPQGMTKNHGGILLPFQTDMSMGPVLFRDVTDRNSSFHGSCAYSLSGRKGTLFLIFPALYAPMCIE